MEHTARSGGAIALAVLKVIGKIIGWTVLTLFTLCVIGVLTMGIFAKIFMTYIDTTLIPSLGDISYEEMTMALASTIYAQDAGGNWIPVQTLFDNGEETGGGNRELIEYEDVPKHLVQALVAIEDKRFWTHRGVDWLGTAASIRDTLLNGNTRGGSTITQQVLRDITQDTEVTVKRKFREIFRALEFEKNTRKEDIITEYLNRVYFGAGCFGIQTAAKTYFGKDVSELDLAESAAIVGITNNPSLYDPFLNKQFVQDDGSIKTPRDFNKRRQEIILQAMLDQELIDEATCNAAKAEKLLFTDTPEYKAKFGDPAEADEDTGEGEGAGETVDTSKVYSWYVDAAIDDAAAMIAEARGISVTEATKRLYRAGYHIYLAQDLSIQEIVDEIYLDEENFIPGGNGDRVDSAITIVDPYTGEVKAMVGGVGVKTVNRGLNLATVPRQPGSAIKPVSVYAPGIEYDFITPASIIDDYPLRVNDAGTGPFPRNATGTYRGYVTVTTGVQISINTVASRVLEKMGYSTAFEFMRNNLGFTTLDLNDLQVSPLAMGGLTRGVTTEEMAAAYGAFMNEGVYNEPRTVLKIENNDHTEVIVDNTTPSSRVAMKETTAYLMSRLLRNVVATSAGTGRHANISTATVAGKTGTTNDRKDLYFAGFSGYYSAAVWTGYAEAPREIKYGNAVSPATRIWATVMERIHESLEDRPLPERPDGITSVTVCADCGLLPNENGLCAADYRGGRTVTAEIQASAAPKEHCTCHIEVRVCTDPETGEVYAAGEYCPEDTVSTRVMLSGRTYIGILDDSGEAGSFRTLFNASDDEAHLTYLLRKGDCPNHDENYVPEPALPGEGEGEGVPLPGEPGFQWPVAPFDPDSVLPQQPGASTEPGQQQPAEPAGPAEPSDPGISDPGASENTPGDEPVPQGPEEPVLPVEPVLP